MKAICEAEFIYFILSCPIEDLTDLPCDPAPGPLTTGKCYLHLLASVLSIN